MLVINRIVTIVLLGIFVSALSPKYVKSETKEDCVDGETYWSEKGVHEQGACVGCVSLETCEQQGVDRKRCIDSCHPKSVNVSSATPKSPDIVIVSPTTSAKSTSPMSSLSRPTVYIETPGFPSLAVLNFSTKANVDKNSHDEKENQKTTLIISLCVVFGVVALFVVALVWWRCRQQKKSAEVEAGRRPFQETETVTRIQNTGERKNSSLGLAEDCW